MKRKVLISVLAIALVLTLCIGIFAACDPKEPAKTEYTVTYSLGEFEGTGTAPAAQKVEEGSKIKLPAVGVTWADHDFLGWKAGADGELLQAGTEVEVKADITYTAQWKENGTFYTVKFNLNGYDGNEQAPADIRAKENSEITLPTISFKWGEKVLSKWELGQGSLEYRDPGSKYTVTADATFYAFWSEPGLKVTVYGPDGTKLGEENATKLEDSYSIYNPAQEYGLEAPEKTYFTYQLYDPATQTKKGAFDYNNFQADGDFSIIVVAESIGEPAQSIEEKWVGIYEYENMMGGYYTTEIRETMIDVYINNGLETLNPFGQLNKSTIWLKDGRYILSEQHDVNPENKDEGKTKPAYYALSLSEDGKTLTVSNLSDPEIADYTFTRKQLTVTVHYTLANAEKSAKLEASTAKEGIKIAKGYTLNNPVEVLDDGAALMDALKVGEIYNLYYYDANAAGHKGAAFDNSHFEATENFDIIIVKESIGSHATSIDQSWYGVYAGEGKYGQTFTLEISNAESGTIIYNDGMDDMSGKVGAEGTIFSTTDGKLVLAAKDWSDSYVYYYFTKNADGTITMESDSGNVTFTRCDVYNVTIYYQLKGEQELKNVTARAIGIDGQFTLDEPVNYLEADYDALFEEFGFGKKFAYYYYDDTKQDKKGDAFDWTDFEPTADFSIIIKIETFATKAARIDESWAGTYTGTCEPWGDFTLTISSVEGTIKLNYRDDLEDPNPVESSILDGTILTTDDGKLVFAGGSSAKYAHYYFITEDKGKFTLDSEYYENVALTKQNDPTVTINYKIDDQMKQVTAGTVVYGEGQYALLDLPVDYLPKGNGDDPNSDYEKFMSGYVYGTQIKYYVYTDGQKGEEFDATGYFNSDIAILIEIEAFATPAKEIDAKYTGSFAGTLNGHAFILTIDATAKTINVDYGTALNPINASIEDGTILTQDGKLVFVEGTLQYVHYYYLTEKEGALTLDCEYTQEPIALVASLKNLVGTYKSTGGGTLVVTTYAAGEYVESYDFTASGSVIYNGELIKVAYGLNDGTWYIQGYHSEYETIQEDGDSYSMAKFFSATVSEGTITVGETTAFTGRTDLVNADMSDFAGYYKQSDNNRYWSIKATQNEDHEDILKVTYGDANPQEANYAIIGDYIYLTYTSQSYTYAYLLQKGESDSLTGTYIAPEKAPVAITFNKADRYADKTNTYTYTPAEGATLDITVSAFGGTADLKITSILLNSFTAPTYAELTMAVGDGAAQTYKLWLEDDTLFKKLSLLIADKDYHVSSPLYTLQDVTGLKAHGFAIALTGEGKIEIYDTSSKEKLGELTNKSYTGGGTDTHPTDTVTYEGNVKVNDLLNVIITKLEFDNIPDPTTVTITGTFGGKEATTTTTLSSNNDYPGYLLEAPKGKPKHYWNVNFSNGGSSATFGIGIYEDGTVVVAEGSGDSYRGTLTKSGEKPAEPEQPKEEDVQITVKAGEGCAEAQWSKQITIKTGTRTCAEITELLGGEDQLPAGTNRYWYFAGYTVNGENYLKSKSIEITKETTEITLYYKDGKWTASDKSGSFSLNMDHFGATTGELTFYNEEMFDDIATYTYTYNLEDNTITLVEKGGSGTEIKGTLTDETKAGYTDVSPHTFGINITLMFNDNPITFGTGSPSTGGTTDTDPFAGTTWSGKADNINKTDVTIEFTADGTIKIQFGSYPELTGTYKYADAKLTVESEGNAVMTSVEITVTLTSDGKSINEFTIECDDEGSDGEHMTYHIKNPTKG